MSVARALLTNRLVLAFLAFAMVVGAINLYVAFHDDGLLVGRVVNTDGRPVPGAEVILYMPALIGIEEIDRQLTDRDGVFRFRDHGQHHPALQVRAPGYTESALRRIRLYFRNQNRRLDAPIVITPQHG